MGEARTQLTNSCARKLAERDVCEVAGTYLLEVELRERLALVAVKRPLEVSVALMAVAILSAEQAPEWGG